MDPVAPAVLKSWADVRPDESPRTWLLAHGPQAVGIAQQTTRALLQEWGADDASIDQALLIVAELVGSSLEHAPAPLILDLGRVAAGNVLHIEVRTAPSLAGRADPAG